jgi:hopanoid biosynthesis associated RND transporter like protein HpnN
MISEQVHAEEAGKVRRGLLALVSTVCRYPRTVLFLSLVLCAFSVYAASAHLQYHTQRNDLISPHKDYQQRWRRYLNEFGDDDDIVVVVQGGERPRMQQALDAIGEQVRKQPDLFDRLFYKVDLRHLHDRALLFLPQSEIQSIEDNLRGMKLLLEFGPLSWSGLTLLSLFQEANTRVANMVPGQSVTPADDQLLTQLRAISGSVRATLADPAAYRNPWSSLMAHAPDQKDLLAEPQYFFSGDGTLAFLLTRPVKEQGSFTAALRSVSAMREIVAQTQSAFPDIEFGLTGMPVLETDEMAAAEHDTRWASGLAIVGVVVLFILVYRGIWYPLLTASTLLIGTAWAMGWLTLTVGHLNILSATFAVMLIGMGDYGVLWVMRYEQARRRGLDVRDSLLHTTTHVAVGNLTAACTLALAFFAAILADFQAVAELGWIAGCGVLLCALACFTVLPALLILLDRRGQLGPRPWETSRTSGPFDAHRRLPTRPARSDTWLPALAQRPGWVLGVGLTLAAALTACAWWIRYDHNLLHLQARNLDSVKWELTLIDHTAGASWHALSYTATAEQALALKARYKEMPEVSDVIEVASLIPAGMEAKVPMLRDIQHRLRTLPQRGTTIPHTRPSLADLRIEVARLIGRLQPLVAAGPRGEKPSLLAELRESLVALYKQLESMPVADVAEIRLQDFEQRLAGDLAEDLHKLREVASPRPITLEDLPTNLRERYLGRTGKWLLRVFAAQSLWDFEPLADFCQKIHTVDPEATGKPFGTVEGLKAMKNGLQSAGCYAFLVIVLVLLLDFRSVKNMLIAVAPLLLGVGLSLGVMGLCGFALNPANMIAFPLILGVGVDNGVHVLHDYLLRRAAGQPGISYAIGRGVMVKAFTTMIGFGTLMISTERGLAGLGFILTLGVCCSMLTALVLLPALLHLLSQRRTTASAPVIPMGTHRQAA